MAWSKTGSASLIVMTWLVMGTVLVLVSLRMEANLLMNALYAAMSFCLLFLASLLSSSSSLSLVRGANLLLCRVLAHTLELDLSSHFLVTGYCFQ